jgi:ADP-ribose pyrophosphatase
MKANGDLKFEIVQTTTVFEGRAFKLRNLLARLPDVKERTFNMVYHTGSVTIVPVDEQGNIWFVRQYRLGAGQELLELPAGTREEGEDHLECARREVREETGMAARELTLLTDVFLAPGYSTEHMYLYLATDLYPAPLEGDEDEFLKVEAIPIKRVLEMAHQGEIHDAKSLAALLAALPALQKYRT